MNTRLVIRNILYGFLSWLIPFVASILFFDREGNLMIHYDLFKSIMIVIGSLTGCLLLFLFFRKLENRFVENGFIVGISWFAINIILDAIFLLPMMKASFADYFASIGLRYVVIPAISVTIGYLLSGRSTRHKPA